MKVETIEIAGLAGALTALRLPFGKEVRSKIENYSETHLDFTDMDVEQTEDSYEVTMKGLLKFTSNTSIAIDKKDLALLMNMQRLSEVLMFGRRLLHLYIFGQKQSATEPDTKGLHPNLQCILIAGD